MAINNANRARLEMSGSSTFYFQGPAAKLETTNGIVFANQPDIVYGQSVNQSPVSLTHTNYTTYAYGGTPSPTIQVTAQFSNVTQEEHEYTQGVIHFLRSVTKMYYGLNESGPVPAGTPPPVLKFSAFGSNQFNNVPVLVGSFNVPFQSDTDLVEVGGQALPALQTIALDLLVTVNPAKQKKDFSKAQFVTGSLYSKGFI
jgi:hypothetical protein